MCLQMVCYCRMKQLLTISAYYLKLSSWVCDNQSVVSFFRVPSFKPHNLSSVAIFNCSGVYSKRNQDLDLLIMMIKQGNLYVH